MQRTRCTEPCSPCTVEVWNNGLQIPGPSIAWRRKWKSRKRKQRRTKRRAILGMRVAEAESTDFSCAAIAAPCYALIVAARAVRVSIDELVWCFPGSHVVLTSTLSPAKHLRCIPSVCVCASLAKTWLFRCETRHISNARRAARFHRALP